MNSRGVVCEWSLGGTGADHTEIMMKAGSMIHHWHLFSKSHNSHEAATRGAIDTVLDAKVRDSDMRATLLDTHLCVVSMNMDNSLITCMLDVLTHTFPLCDQTASLFHEPGYVWNVPNWGGKRPFFCLSCAVLLSALASLPFCTLTHYRCVFATAS